MKIGLLIEGSPFISNDIQAEFLKKEKCKIKKMPYEETDFIKKWNLFLLKIKKKDKIIIASLHSLNFNLSSLILNLEYLTSNSITLIILDLKISIGHGSNLSSSDLICILSNNHYERLRKKTLLLKEQRKKHGFSGRPTHIKEKDRKTMFDTYDAGDITVTDLCEKFNISRNTFYRYLKKRYEI